MVDFEVYKRRFLEASESEKEAVFEELLQKNLSWRTRREGSIVQMLKPKLVSSSYENKKIVVTYPLSDWELNPLGALHGGITATMIDNQGGLLTQTLTLCNRTPTVYLNVNYTAPLFPGDNLMITVWATHQGKRMVDIMAEARSERDGRMIATAMVGYMAIDHADKKC